MEPIVLDSICLPPTASTQVWQAEELLQRTSPGGTTYLLYIVNEPLDITRAPRLAFSGPATYTHSYATRALVKALIR